MGVMEAISPQNYHAQALEQKDELVRDVTALLGWGDHPDAQAEACQRMGYDVDPDEGSEDIALDALAQWPLGVERRVVHTIYFGVGGPTRYVEIDARDNEVIGGRYITTEPGYAISAPTQTIRLTEKEADALAVAFLPEL